MEKDWYSIYNKWDRLKQISYSEENAKILTRDFAHISLFSNGLRENNFNLIDHKGQARLSTPISQVTEKRFIRALYNFGQDGPIDHFGKIIDYEVPLKKAHDSKHGDIDLVVNRDSKLMIVEAKQHKSNESILKGLIQAYVYSLLINSVKKAFYLEYSLSSKIILTPAILSFKSSSSGKQILSIDDYPNTVNLIKAMNQTLLKSGLNPFCFFIIFNSKEDVDTSLTTGRFDGEGELILFKKNFIPDIQEIKIL